MAWNDDATAVAAGATTLSATGGGVSTIYTTKPSWQTGVPGIPSDGKRDVPDVSFYASPDLPGYLFCTSDTSDWNTSQAPVQQASCNSGFRDSSTSDLDHCRRHQLRHSHLRRHGRHSQPGPELCSRPGPPQPHSLHAGRQQHHLCRGFHDVTTGNNECPSSLRSVSSFCSTASEGSYTTTAGYDLVTGLGSVNLSALVTAWPASTSALIGTTTSVTAANATPAVSTNDTITITVASDSGTTTPTGNCDPLHRRRRHVL